MGYAEVYKSWQDDPEGFWMEQAKAISWDKPPSKALHAENAPLYEWYKDAQVNACYNAVDRHVEAGRGDQTAIIYDSPITGNKSKTSFAELQVQTASLAGALQAKGIVAGDRVIIYMPMVTEALVAMLACARIGAVHSVVFGGFAAHELAVRIDDATPKAIIAASCGLEPNRIVAYKPLIDGAIEQSKHKPDFTIVLQREQHTCDMIDGRDFDWTDEISKKLHYGVADILKLDDEAKNSCDVIHFIMEDGNELSKTYHRNSLTPGQDLTGIPANVVAHCNVAWTAEVIAAYQAAQAAQAESIGA